MFKGLLLLASSATCLFALCSTASAEGSSRVFTGTLGKMPIVLGLNTAQEDEVIGRYFYEKYHRDLGLSGSLQEKTPDAGRGRYPLRRRPITANPDVAKNGQRLAG